jgi:endo-1,4-beta-mannosidase
MHRRRGARPDVRPVLVDEMRRWSLQAVLVLTSCAALLAGCEGGTLTNYSQSCTSTGMFGEETVTCSGTAGSVRGSVGIEFGGDDEELDGTYRLAATLSVEEGEASVYAYDADGERVSLGRLSEGTPLRVEAVVDPSGDSSVFFVDAGEGEVRGLSYEGRIEPV